MAEYRVEFTADSGSAERSIKNLKKEIKGVTKEFESAEIGAGDFIEAASNLSGLQKELKDARREVVDIDGAYKTLSQTMAQFRSGMGARGAISSVASPIRGGAQQFGSPAYFDALNKDLEQAIKEGRQLDTEIQRAAESREQAIANFRTGMGARGASQVASSVQGTPQQFGSPAYFDALNKSLRMAIDEGRQLDAEIKRAAESREQAIMEFRAGMGARGAIPAVASPVRGGIEYGPAYGSAGSPAYLEEVARAAQKAQQELDEAAKAAGTIAPRVKAFNPASLAAYEAKLKILKAEARLILPDSKRWKELNKEILKLERGVERINKKQRLGPSARQRAGAAGGAFLYGGGMGGGPGSALGGIAGGLMGGVPGAFTGAAIGQAVDSLGGALAGITSQAAAVQQLQRGLALASIDAKDFAEAQSAVADVSSRLFIPLEQVTKSFAQLRVNTKQYGLSVEETKQILEGTILAVSAFGGSADDVDGAMRAVVQILSKGSVQAEELRGQLGERFPGAVIKFAQANKLSFDELQDRLKEGTIGIKEFVTFAKDNYEDYAEFSKTISTAPEFAGRRLAKALEEMQMVIGQVFGSSGATIQDFSSQALKDITQFVVENKELLAQLAQDFAVVFAGIMSVVAEAGKFIIKVLAPVLSYIGSVIRQLRVMTGAADAATAKAEMDAANVIIQRTGMGRDAYLSGEPRPRSFADKIEFDAAQERYERAEKRFKDAGGQAALPPETGTPPNLTFGGAGAGVSIEAAAPSGGSGKAKAKKAKELQDYIRNEQDFLRQLAQIAQNRLEITMGLSNEELNILKSQAEFRASNAINEQQYLEDQRNAAEYSVATRDQYLKDIKERYDNEKTLIQQQFDQSVYAPFLALERQLIGENEDLAASLDALKQGRLDLTVEERIGLQVGKQLQAMEAAGLTITPDIIQSIKDKAKAQDAYNQSLSYGKTILALQNQLALAQILDPRAERRAQIRQENPRLSDMQVENQAALEEQVAAAAQSRDQLRSIASSIGDAFGTAFKGIITGTSSVREALAGLFQSIADSFADMVAKMLAEWAKTQIIKGLQMILGAIIPGMGGGFTPLSNEQATSFNFNPGAMTGGTPWTFANGGIAPGGFTAFANGGMVTGPTMGLVGEGRYNEAIVPLPDGKSIPVQLAGGDGGNQIISNITVNVNNGQAQSNATGSNSSEMGRKIEGAVKQVIVGELRPGGLLASKK
jgi:tape measure domain-containing protein